MIDHQKYKNELQLRKEKYKNEEDEYNKIYHDANDEETKEARKYFKLRSNIVKKFEKEIEEQEKLMNNNIKMLLKNKINDMTMKRAR